MKYVYESPDKGKTVYRRPARMPSRKLGNGIQTGHIREGIREVRLQDGSWQAVGAQLTGQGGSLRAPGA